MGLLLLVLSLPPIGAVIVGGIVLLGLLWTTAEWLQKTFRS
jgi:hypothetical protein